MAILVKPLLVGEYQMNCYIVQNTATRACVIVDPGADGARIIDFVGGLTPAAVLLTHGHYDHIGAADAVCGHFGIPLYVHAQDAPKLTDAQLNVSAQFGLRVEAHTPPTLLSGGEQLTLAGIPIEVLHTAGHSAGGCCYLLPNGQGLLSGDTLFAHGYGRTDFQDGDMKALMQSLRMLVRLTPQMPLYPGHGEMGTVGRAHAPEAL